ncbi:MAG: DUF72 domain-containing protein [Bacteroidota bacterium]
MEFGKLESIDAIDFKLPADHTGTLKVLGMQKAGHCKVHVGCPIWAEEGFVGKIFPPKTKRKDFLKYYSKQFNSIELNVSHYKPLDVETINHWVDITESNFLFCPKVNQSISHTPLLIYNVPLFKELFDLYKQFKQKLGMPFLQLPNSYDSSKINDLLDFLDQCAISNFAIELRHESWFNNETVLKQVCNYFYKNNITFLMTDVAGRRDVLHNRLTTKTTFIRFIANDLHESDFKRLDEWTDKLKLWIDNGLEQIYFCMHTPSNVLLPELITYFMNELSKKTGIALKPPTITAPYTGNNTLF